MANQFLVSVADAIGRDASTGDLLFVGKANISSSFTMSTQKTEVRGGIGNAILYTYYHDKALEVKIEAATFEKSLLALNAGTTVVTGSTTVVKQESVTLVAGVGTVTETPTGGKVSVLLPDGSIQNLTPNGSEITVSGGAAQTVTAIYEYTDTDAQYVTGFSTLPPTGIDLTLISEVRNAATTLEYYFVINVPNFNVSGNYTMALSANGVSQQSLDGMAAVTTDAAGDYYFKAYWIPTTTTTAVAYTDIAATPSVITFSAADLPDTQQLSVLGIKGGIYANVNITTSCTFEVTSGCTDVIWSGSTGVISACATAIENDAAVVEVSYWDVTSGSLSDTMNVAIGA